MTTPESANGKAADPLRRPELERTEPKRNILNAFRQTDGRALDDAFLRSFAQGIAENGAANGANGANEAGAAQAEARSQAQKQAQTRTHTQPQGWAPGPLWSGVSDSVKAGYEVINRQILEGQAAAAQFAAPGGATAGARNVPELLNRLVRTYSDMGAVWVDLLSAALEREATAATAQAPQPATGATASAVAVELIAAQRVTARARLYRGVAGELTALSLRSTGKEGGELTGVTILPGPVVQIDIPTGTAAGSYHGILLEEGAEEPAGSVSVTVAP